MLFVGNDNEWACEHAGPRRKNISLRNVSRGDSMTVVASRDRCRFIASGIHLYGIFVGACSGEPYRRSVWPQRLVGIIDAVC